MESFIKSSLLKAPISLHDATVIHANKFSTAHDGGLNVPIWSNLHIELVFRLQRTNEDWRVYVKNLDLPIYTSQEVSVVTCGETVLAYIDKQTNYYYYLTRDFSGKLGIGMPFFLVWLIGIVGGIIDYLMQQEVTVFLFVPIATLWLIYMIQKWIANFRIKREIDRFLS